MYKLSKLDPLEADPSNIRIAIRTLSFLKIQRGDVTLNLGYVSKDLKTNLEENLVAEINLDDFATKVLLEGKKKDETVTIFYLTEEDALKMRQFQKLVSRAKESGEDGKGSLGVNISGSCLTKSIPKDELLVDIFLQVDPQESYFMIVEDLNLLAQKGMVELQNWPVCDEKV